MRMISVSCIVFLCIVSAGWTSSIAHSATPKTQKQRLVAQKNANNPTPKTKSLTPPKIAAPAKKAKTAVPTKKPAKSKAPKTMMPVRRRVVPKIPTGIDQPALKRAKVRRAVPRQPAKPLGYRVPTKDKKKKGKKGKKRKFYKGELSLLGVITFTNPFNFGGLELGYLFRDKNHYISATPKVSLHFLDYKLHLDFAIPLNIQFAKDNVAGTGLEFTGGIRQEDWDQWQDFFKVIRRVQFGRKEDNFYVRLSQVGAATLGHGGLVRRYNSNLFANTTHLSLELDAYNDYVGGELFIGDMTFQNRVMGFLAFFKPLSLVTKNKMARSLSIGFYYVGDMNAPDTLTRNASGIIQVDDVGNPEYKATGIHSIGLDAEFKPVKIGNSIDLKAYIDYWQLLGFGNAITIGTLLRSNFGKSSLMALRARLEYTNMGNQYIPNYFDTFYEIQKLQMVTGDKATQSLTKLGFLKSIDYGGRGHSLYAEVTFSIVDVFSFSTAYEASSGQLKQNFLMHAELFALSGLTFFVTFHKRNFDSWSTLFSSENSENTLIYGQLELQLFPFLFINGKVARSYVWDVKQDNGKGGLRNILDYSVTVSFGKQWGPKRSKTIF